MMIIYFLCDFLIKNPTVAGVPLCTARHDGRIGLNQNFKILYRRADLWHGFALAVILAVSLELRRLDIP